MAQILIESEALDSLKRMVEELEKDAARYRWLRDEGFERPADFWVIKIHDGQPVVNTDLDKLIDTAMRHD